MQYDSCIAHPPMDCFNNETAEQFIGHDGYFTNCLADFSDLSKMEVKSLIKINRKLKNPFISLGGEDQWAYFLPLEWVSFKTKPFNLDTFTFEIGDIVTFRYKGDPDTVMNALITQIETSDTETLITLGSTCYDFDELYRDYELQDATGKWVPFGQWVQTE